MATSNFYVDGLICDTFDCTNLDIDGAIISNTDIENSTLIDCKQKSAGDSAIIIDTSALLADRTISYKDTDGTVALENTDANFVNTTMATLVVNSYLGPTNDGIIINGNNVGFSNGLLIKDLGTPKFAIQTNPGSGESYLNSIVGPLKFLVGNSERLRILNTGIPNNNALTNMLCLNGTVLSFKNDVMDLGTAQTATAAKTLLGGLRCTSILDNTGGNNVQINNDIAVNISNAVTLTGKTIVIDNQTSLITTRAFGSMGYIGGTAVPATIGTAGTYVVCPATMVAYSPGGRFIGITGGNTLNDVSTVANKTYLLSYTFCGSYTTNNLTISCKLRSAGGTVDIPGSTASGSSGNAPNVCCVSNNNILFQSSGVTNFQLWITLSTTGILNTISANVTFQTIN